PRAPPTAHRCAGRPRKQHRSPLRPRHHGGAVPERFRRGRPLGAPRRRVDGVRRRRERDLAKGRHRLAGPHDHPLHRALGRVAGDRETGAALSDTVLAVLTHPDDCEIACGGTLAKWAGEGRAVTIAVLTDGRRGSQDPTEDVEALILTRRREQEAGAALMGATDVRFFDYRDGELENTPAVRRDVVRLIRELHPKIV